MSLSPVVQPDKFVHEPARLAILTVLSGCKSAEFLFLQRATQLTKGNLSVQMSKLEEAGFIEIDKAFEGKKPVTSAALTAKGARALKQYWEAMDEIRRRGNGKRS
ncbi:MAG TPA: transcriptional regulator [Bryobacteraceae bacterium]|nr:transcriptional regulator [Bryobacteraceae bacterium]